MSIAFLIAVLLLMGNGEHTTMPNDIITNLNPDRTTTWAKRLSAAADSACTPLTFSVAGEPNMPVPFEVTRNGDSHVIIHFFRRPSIARPVGDRIVQAALLECFGKPSASMPRTDDGALQNVFYRDEEEIRKRMQFKKKVLEADSWYVEFPLGLSSILPPTDNIRDALATALKGAWVKYGVTTG